MQSLGFSIDIALQTKRSLIVDWRDESWDPEEGFEGYFRLGDPPLKTLPVTRLQALDNQGGSVWPKPWQGILWSQPSARDLDRAYKMKRIQTSGAGLRSRKNVDVLVACRYLATYSDALFSYLTLQPYVIEAIKEALVRCSLVPGKYSAWHIRHTDKKGTDPSRIAGEIQRRVDKGRKVVVCTDNVEILSLLPEEVIHPVSIPIRKGPGGLHHSKPEWLKKQGFTRIDVNIGAIVDLFILGLSGSMFATCGNSSFSRLAARGRHVGWFRREYHQLKELP